MEFFIVARMKRFKGLLNVWVATTNELMYDFQFKIPFYYQRERFGYTRINGQKPNIQT